MQNIAIIGSSISGNLAAAFLKQRFPQMEVVVIGPASQKRPLVGESLIEPSTSFIREIGLGSTLVDRHFPKYGLTYYYKRNFDEPEDRAYVVAESPFVLPFLSFNINRYTFDEDLEQLNRDRGVVFREGKVRGVEVDASGRKRLEITDASGEVDTMDAQWVVDASGRSRLLAKQFQLHDEAPVQRSSFWFRLVDFDRNFLDRLEALQQDNVHFDSFYCTHHFFGKGNWIWAIPMRRDSDTPMLSIGISYCPDQYSGRIASIDDFRERVAAEHPVLAELVESGRVLDENRYYNYMYRCRQHYSEDGWFIIGDAGHSVDPLYSMGMTFTSLQIRQVAAVIEAAEEGREFGHFVQDLDEAFTNYHRVVTDEITRLYDVMDDSFQCHLRQHLAQFMAFNAGFPLLMAGYLTDPVGVKFFGMLFDPKIANPRLELMYELLSKVASRRPDRTSTADFLPVSSADSVNMGFFGTMREDRIPAGLARALTYNAVFRWRLLRKLGWTGLLEGRQILAMLADLFQGAMFRLLFKGSILRKHPMIVKMAKRPRPPASSTGDSARLLPEST